MSTITAILAAFLRNAAFTFNKNPRSRGTRTDKTLRMNCASFYRKLPDKKRGPTVYRHNASGKRGYKKKKLGLSSPITFSDGEDADEGSDKEADDESRTISIGVDAGKEKNDGEVENSRGNDKENEGTGNGGKGEAVFHIDDRPDKQLNRENARTPKPDDRLLTHNASF
ncbi:MAG: hypothetical protein HYT22_01770 [Candidatus Niyogibacteria bacterium]|nr:hypothetical protein [Candidatus Niyogibacteria bacterium]